jgi:hypothetical protein
MTNIKDHPYGDNHYVVLAKQLDEITFQCGILVSAHEPEAENPFKIGDRIWINKDDAQTYIQEFKNNKDLQYNANTKKLLLVDRPVPILIPIPLPIQAKQLYEQILSKYGSGYLWNKLTKLQQKELTIYLDTLDDIIKDDTQSATELPIKPNFLL